MLILEERTGAASIDEVLRSRSVRSVLQPIVDLESGAVVGYEALARGPQGPLAAPLDLFAAARDAGRLADLDAACRLAAFRAGVEQGVTGPLWLFVNVEPEVLDLAPLDDLLAIADGAEENLKVVVEITERAIAARPAELLRTVDKIRSLGWRIALDDVGADDMSLAFMPLLQPEVVKLDLRLVQQRPGPDVAAVMHAVNAYAEATGAVLLAEGIEDAAHVETARSLGARLGQGWHFGRPAESTVTGSVVGDLRLPARDVPDLVEASPFDCLPAGTPTRRSTKPLLIEVSKHLEREATRHGRACVVVSAFQHEQFFTPATARRYGRMTQSVGFVAALGQGLPDEPAAGVRGTSLADDDVVTGEWDVVVLSPHFAAALLAREVTDVGDQRLFEFGLTYDRETVVQAAQVLLARVAPLRKP